jgi:hypothetical protein
MKTAGIRIEKIRLKDLKKISPEILNGNGNRRGNLKNKTKDKQQAAKTSKPKSRA